jgi:hypothetical protein
MTVNQGCTKFVQLFLTPLPVKEKGHETLIPYVFTIKIFYTYVTTSAFVGVPPTDTATDRMVSQLEQRAHQFEWDAEERKGVARVQLEHRVFR